MTATNKRRKPVLWLGKDFGAVLKVELGHVLGGEERPVVLVRLRRRQHRRDQGAGARSGDHIEVVRNARIGPVQFLQFVGNQSAETQQQAEMESVIYTSC